MDVDRIGIHESVSTVFPPGRLRDELAGRGAGPDGERADGPAVAVVDDDELAGCDAVVTFEHVDAFLEDVDWVHSVQAGVDRFPFAAFEAAGVALTNSSGIHGESVGETVAGYMLSFARRLHRHRDAQRERTWRQPEWDEAFTLAGEPLCVVGLGTLGRGIVERANGLGMRVTGVRRSGDPVEGVEAVHPPGDLRAAVADARFVALAVPLTDETAGLVDRAVLEAMREDAYLINVARGPVVDEDALIAALRGDDLAGAALDVFEAEPLPEESPLWDRREVVVTPHCAAFTRDYYLDVADLVRENLARVAAGEPLHNRVV